VNPRQPRFRLGAGHILGGTGHSGGWQAKDDISYPVDVPAGLTHYFAMPAITLPVRATRGSIDEKALRATSWLDRAALTPGLLMATLYRFLARPPHRRPQRAAREDLAELAGLEGGGRPRTPRTGRGPGLLIQAP